MKRLIVASSLALVLAMCGLQAGAEAEGYVPTSESRLVVFEIFTEPT